MDINLSKLKNAVLKRIWFKPCRNVYFITETMSSTASVVRGAQIAQELLKQGVFADVIDFDDPGNLERIRRIRDGIVVFVKGVIKGQTQLLEFLKQFRNTLIWDPIDGLSEFCSLDEVKIFDGAIFSNARSVDVYKSNFSRQCIFHVIPHHWDPRCEKNAATVFNLIYFGNIESGNITREYMDRIPKLHIEPIIVAKTVQERDIFKRLLDYSCHFSVRSEDSASFIFKPGVKVALASGMHANIIVSRDFSNMEILDSSYPFYTSADFQDVVNTIEKAKKTYGTKVWFDALDMMAEVREKTSLSRVCKEYIRNFHVFY